MQYVLLGTAGCHLCELAEALINECISEGMVINLTHIDIAEQIKWQADFATLIPVLYHSKTQQSLNWPFSKAQILTFIDHNYG